MDEAFCLPSEEAVQVALRTQQLIAHEAGVTDTVDPLAGSYYIEKLTQEVYDRAREYIATIDELGGAAAAIEKGYIQREIQDSAYRYQKEIEKDERVVVGVNRFQIEEEPPKDLLRVDPAVRISQVERLEKLRSERNNDKVQDILSGLRKAAGGSDNLMPIILEAVRAYATLGEICDALRDVFGEYQPVSTLGG
jgi:methylmalonyl-CoA mutase N-terminal domain/subunit